jgi:vibriolysin
MTLTSIRRSRAAALAASVALLFASWSVSPAAQRQSPNGDGTLTAPRARIPATRLGVTPAQRQALDSYGPAIDVELDDRDVPKFLMGKLSRREHADPVSEAHRILKQHGDAFRRNADDDFVHRTHERDALGQTHVRMSQTYKGLRVIGGELVVHLSDDAVIGVNGRFIADLNVNDTAVLSGAQAAERAVSRVRAEAGSDISVVETKPAVVFAGTNDLARLAIPVMVRYVSGNGPEMDEIFVDAADGSVVGREPQVLRARYRVVYSAHNWPILQGDYLFEEGGSSSDISAMGAYNGTGATYDFYKVVFGRDSVDNRGWPLISTVHYGTQADAAWWPSGEMSYGDGDGTRWGDLASALDVTAHEITHGVTQFTSKLEYHHESGALNEASSDILGEATAFFYGKGDWKLGAEVYTPGRPDDALRYMDNPTRDAERMTPRWPYYSADYYPERLFASEDCSPVPYENDSCGVHYNSGIANLFFYLLSVGGTHPRQKTDVLVPGIGIEKARQIWYRALTAYMTPTTTFADARSATARAAADLYGGACSPDWIAVQKGWDAVGVPGNWSCGCTMSLSAASQSVDAGDGSGSVGVTIAEGCSWTASSNAAFITVTSGASATGNGTVAFSVSPNPDPGSRTGTLTIGGLTFTVTQAGAGSCTVTISPGSQATPASGAAGSFAVAAPPGCPWTATTSASFITLTAASGNGNGTVAFVVAPNPGAAPRTGSITAGEQNFAITQEAAACATCAASDFNGDARPDIVWRNYLNGANAVWFMQDAEKIGAASLPVQYDIYLAVDAVGDFNADGKTDLLLRDYYTGSNTIWYFDGTTRIGTASLPTVFDTMWRIEGVGDFNGDRHPDIVWRHYVTGQNAIWYMNGATRIGSASLPAISATSESIDAVADLNADGHPDLVVRNYSNGANRVLFMNGIQQIGSAPLPAVADTAWQIGGVGDFNGDGRQDVVWRNQSSGANMLWYLSGPQVVGTAVLPPVSDTNWWIVGVAR